MKFSMPVAEFRTLLRALGSVVNPRSIQPSFRHVAVRCQGGVLSFAGCSQDLMTYAQFETGHSKVKFDAVESGFTLDLGHYQQLLQTFSPEELVVVTYRSHEGSVRFTCGRHVSEHGVDHDARVTDIHSPTDFGGLATEPAWTRFDAPLDEMMKRVEFAMLRREDTYTFDETQLDSIRVRFDEQSVVVEATDNTKFAHFRALASLPHPEADFLLPKEAITQIHRHGFTRVYWNKHAFCFRGGKTGVDLYCRSLGRVNEFPDLAKVFEKFREGKYTGSMVVNRSALLRVLQRQALFTKDPVNKARVAIKPESKELEFSVPGIGSDVVKFIPETGDRPMIYEIDPSHLLACLDRLDVPDVALMIHQQKDSALVGFRPVLPPPPPPGAMMHPDQIPEAIGGFDCAGFAPGTEFFFVASAIPVVKA